MKKEPNKLSVYLISNMYPSQDHPSYGIFVKNFKDSLSDHGAYFSGMSVIRGRGKTPLQKGIKYLRFYFSIVLHLLLKQSQFDIIYVHYVSHSAPALLLFNLIRRKKLVINVHGSDVLPGSAIGKFLQFFSKMILQRADLVVTPSEYYRQIIINKFKVTAEKTFVSASGGVNLNLFAAKDAEQSRKRLNIPSGIFVMGFVSRIDEGKGWDLFLEAVQRLKEFDLLGVVAGSGGQADSFKRMIRELDIESRVLYLGMTDQQDLPYIYSGMDLFIFPTTRSAESLGLVGVEALACGVPVIGSRIGGLPGFIEDGKNGYLFETGNVDELTEKITVLLRNNEKLQRLKQNCRKSILQYDEETIATQLYQKLNEMVNKDRIQ